MDMKKILQAFDGANDVAPPADATDMKKFLSIVVESKDSGNRLTQAEQLAMQTYADPQKVIKPDTTKKGLFKENCELEINLFDSNEHSSLYSIDGITNKFGSQTIGLVRGDDFIKENNIVSIDFLKLDVEGAEYDALLGFENAFKEGIIKLVQFEYGFINISTKKLLIDYYTFFEAHGYILGKVFPKNVEFRNYNVKHEDFIGPNFIAVKKTETELIDILRNS